MVQIGFGGTNIAPVILTGATPADIGRRVQDQQTSRPVRETEETDDGGDRAPDTLLESGERTDEIRARDARDQEAMDAAQAERRREEEDREPRPGDRVDLRV